MLLKYFFYVKVIKEYKISLTKEHAKPSPGPIGPSALGHDGLPDRCPIFQRTQNAIQLLTSPYLSGLAAAHTF